MPLRQRRFERSLLFELTDPTASPVTIYECNFSVPSITSALNNDADI